MKSGKTEEALQGGHNGDPVFWALFDSVVVDFATFDSLKEVKCLSKSSVVASSFGSLAASDGCTTRTSY